jgi:hypothetical protein
MGKRPTLDVVYWYIDFFPSSKMDGVWMMKHFFIEILEVLRQFLKAKPNGIVYKSHLKMKKPKCLTHL